ncbi:hypothetical protein PMAC_001831 [Pneumocystis sp. 'macacae']|nr:hypothetical protein PMAC_001831 [Pneumocystis sp. 'macacae']
MEMYEEPGGTNELPGPSQKLSLLLWWKQFKHRQGWKKFVAEKTKGIFGVPLQISLQYANVAISFIDDNGNPNVYGYVPIVVAKCGAFLKENAKSVEGIFRLNGSAKRCKELQTIFDSQPKYGRDINWDNFTVHDAASVLRRYLNYLPEPIIPHKFYQAFRKPLRNEFYNEEEVILTYKELIASLPPMNQQLLLYILDLLAFFSSKSDENLMTISNLSSVFQPGILSHPEHDMSPKEYYLSQSVIVFLISHQNYFSMNTITPNPKLVLLDDNENSDFSEAFYTGDSGKYASKKKSNVLKKSSYTNPKSQNSYKNRNLKLEEFSLKKPFQFLSHSNILPYNLTKRTDHCTMETLIPFKKSNTLKSSKFSLENFFVNENKFVNKIRRKSSYSTFGTSTESSFVDSASEIFRNTDSIYTLSSLGSSSWLSQKFQKKILNKTLPMNISSSSLKTIGTYSNIFPLKLKTRQSFSSLSTQSVCRSQADSISSSIMSEDRFSKDSSVFDYQIVRRSPVCDIYYP